MKPWEEKWDGGVQWGWVLVTNAPGIPLRPLDGDRMKLAAAAPDMARVLLASEWGGRKVVNREIDACCPVCRAYEPTHAKDCALDAALRKAGVR